jgi:hypothetical protein
MRHPSRLQHAAGPNNMLCMKYFRGDSTWNAWRQDYPVRCHQKTGLVMENFIQISTNKYYHFVLIKTVAYEAVLYLNTGLSEDIALCVNLIITLIRCVCI